MSRRAGIFALLLAVAGCNPPAAPAPEQSNSAPTTLLSLSPAITETVALLGGADRLLGRSDWCNEPAAIRSLPAFGTSLTPALERIAAVRPARILIDGSVANQRDALRAIAPVEEFPWLTVTEVEASTRQLGRLVGQPERADALASRFELWQRPVPADAPEVLLLIGDDGPETGTFWFVKEGSLHGAMLHLAGWRNAIREEVATPSLSAEGLLRLDPPAIVVLVPRPGGEAEATATRAKFAGFAGLRAAKSGRLGVISDPAILSTGPSLLDAGDKVTALLHSWTQP